MKAGRRLRTFRGPSQVRSVSFSPDGLLLAAGGVSTVQVWQVRALKTATALGPYQNPTGLGVVAVLFASDSRTVISGMDDGTIRLTDVTTGTPMRTMKANGLYSLALSPHNGTLVSGEHNGAGLWDLQRHILVERLGAIAPDPGTLYEFEHVGISGDGRWVATYFRQKGGSDLILWDARRRIEVLALRPPTRQDWAVRGLSFSPDSRALAVATPDRVVVKTVKSGTVSALLHAPSPDGRSNPSLEGLAYSPDGSMVAFGNSRVVIVWTLKQ
ncbi:MAG TPA: hypothetical protein VFM04_00210 [Candidatus Methylomirabilis sp.]|nr:hypothetical protein [Candidatus Methylomirabilis sp.]